MSLGVERDPEKGQVIAKHPFLLTDHACVGVDGGRGQHDVKILWRNLRKNMIGPALNNEPSQSAPYVSHPTTRSGAAEF